ncbi:MAG TPA: M48 family metallopeptidase [Gemmatimonadaceae bacterium]|nr:M48 family metallopeptidase [Gemmatimonadaceae bacterium]
MPRLTRARARIGDKSTPLSTTQLSRLGSFLAIAALLSSCDVSEEQEVAIGQQTAQDVAAQIPVVADPYIASYINEIGDTIASHTSRRDLDWHFFVVNSHQVNAFALPGGFIYVNRGLIESADRFDQLAGVLGHEIGHVIQRHSVKQMQNQQKLGAVAQLACTLTNICESELGQAAINIGGTALVARYSRADELEADSEAVENVLRVRIDPEGIPSLFEVLMQQRRSEPSVVESWFSTHPLEESRIEHARVLIKDSGAATAGGLLQNLPSFIEFKRRIAALPEPQRSPAQR